VKLKRREFLSNASFLQIQGEIILDWNNQVAVITGAAQGIGKAIALELASVGVTVIIADIAEPRILETVNEFITCGYKAVPARLDVSDPAAVETVFKKIIDEQGRLDILVNNAGITRDGLLMRMKDEDWKKVIDINLTGTFYCCREAVPAMIRSRYGRIINVASVVGQMGNAGQANYVASKSGLIGLTKSMAREFAGRQVTVNAVAPGFIDTEMTRILPDSAREKLLSVVPLGRPGYDKDVAYTVKFLASPQAGYITGQVIGVNGGMYM
jgi:3-oxoacyl-[acyl-carrier protein] reductase